MNTRRLSQIILSPMILSVLLLLAFPMRCPAPLTATVTPGKVFAEGERPTAATLNRLGNPTVTVSGTVDGTAGITAGTVTGTLLADSVPGTNLTFDGSSPRKLVIKNYGVGSNQLDSAAFTLGLSGGSGTAVRVKYDTNTITLNSSNQLSLASNLPASILAWNTNTLFGAVSYPTNGYGTNTFGGTNSIATNGPITLPTAWYINGQTLTVGQLPTTNVASALLVASLNTNLSILDSPLSGTLFTNAADGLYQISVITAYTSGTGLDWTTTLNWTEVNSLAGTSTATISGNSARSTFPVALKGGTTFTYSLSGQANVRVVITAQFIMSL